MALSTSPECDETEFLTFDYLKDAAHLCDVDLTCYESYESFYDTPCEEENSDIKYLYEKDSRKRLEMFERNETTIGYCSKVPDVNCMWPNEDDIMHDVLRLYNIVKGELFGDFSPDDATSCLPAGDDSLALEAYSLGLQQVPTLIDATDNVQPCFSPCTLEKTGTQTSSLQSPARSTESDSLDDARVPSSCTSDFNPSGLYYIEE